MNRGTIETGKTVIGSNCLFMANSHVGHDCIVGNYCILANSVALAGHVTLYNWVIIGGLTPVHQFVQLGDHSMIGGGLRVSKDTPPFVRAGREPLSYEGINSIGLRRRGFSPEKIKEIQDIYRIIYLRGYNVSQSLAIIEAEMPATSERDEIISFTNNSSRGIMKGYSRTEK